MVVRKTHLFSLGLGLVTWAGGCNSSGSGGAGGAGMTHTGVGGASASRTATQHVGPDGGPATAFIGSLKIATVGSTVDTLNGDQNPYGLTIAPATAGKLTAGDLVICNFSDAANVEGNGTTIEILHPTSGSTDGGLQMPQRFVQDPNLKGCAALAIGTDNGPWAAAYSANLAPFYDPAGALVSTLSAGSWNGAWGRSSRRAPARAPIPT